MRSIARDKLHDPTYLLPHRPPMVLIDRVADSIPEGITCEVDITPASRFFDGRGVPAFVAVEYMAQTVGAFAGAINRRMGKEPDIGFLVGSRAVTLQCAYFAPGQTLRVTVRRVWDGVKLVQFSGRVEDKATGALLAQAQLSLYSPDRTEEDVRTAEELLS